AVTVKFQADGAAHGGGHCQFSLSYDGGKTFVVVHEELKYCFFGQASDSNSASILSYTFNLPSNLPSSDKAVFAWTWVNAIGNREFYMNCADVAIKGTSTSFTGKRMTIANHDGYPTIPEFNGNYDTGLEYYNNVAQITVTGSGSSSSGGSSSSSAYSSSSVGTPIGHAPQSTTTTAVVAVPTPVYSSSAAPAPVYSSSAAPAPAYSSTVPAPVYSSSTVPAPKSTCTSVATTKCTHGVMRCDSTGYKVCVWGKWHAKINCPARTACKQTSASAVICDWA
ncbi:hypothetical protein FB639_003889, partial [Coemansia asiatica]